LTSTKYIGMDLHKESISIAVRNVTGKIAMEGLDEGRTCFDRRVGIVPPHRFQFSSRVWPRRTADAPSKITGTIIDRKRIDRREISIYFFDSLPPLLRRGDFPSPGNAGNRESES
jgi:hypothetical protein